MVSFKAKETKTITVAAKAFPISNGGIFTVSVERLLPVFFKEYQTAKNADKKKPEVSSGSTNPTVRNIPPDDRAAIAFPPNQGDGLDFKKQPGIQLPDKRAEGGPLPEQLSIARWFAPIGEISFFKKPNKYLKLEITTSKDVYAPGD